MFEFIKKSIPKSRKENSNKYEKSTSGIRKIGDQGERIYDFDGYEVLVETGPKDIEVEGNTLLRGHIYRAYINKEERTGLICVNIETGQRYWANNNAVITIKFALLVEPYQIVSIIDKSNQSLPTEQLFLK